MLVGVADIIAFLSRAFTSFIERSLVLAYHGRIGWHWCPNYSREFLPHYTSRELHQSAGNKLNCKSLVICQHGWTQRLYNNCVSSTHNNLMTNRSINLFTDITWLLLLITSLVKIFKDKEIRTDWNSRRKHHYIVHWVVNKVFLDFRCLQGWTKKRLFSLHIIRTLTSSSSVSRFPNLYL